ncbi:nodulation protein NodH [Pseudaestuariivita rosea]|uniref:nodulation protein NodH n=1 Tax=Pseudaestuariivita rosea TaxID=2763263 RepID=UPI001ABB8CC0|nr:nodulation protein NodH [Pseudaestuariivita rosea]
MAEKFDYFVMFAGMRTGSNLLESYLNAFAGVTCFGEAFNPSFIGYPKHDSLLGMTLEDRQSNPQALLDAIKADDGLGGFRYFQDHDPRIMDQCLTDPACAKIVLTRNPLDSFVSREIARKTDQWKLTNAKYRKSAKIHFDQDALSAYLDELNAFYGHIKSQLQKTGQTAFFLDYDDLNDVQVINGLAGYLGIEDRLDKLSTKLKKQNPQPLKDKIENYDQVEATLEIFDLFKPPNFEPRRGPNVPSYITTTTAPLLYLPIAGGPNEAIKTWMSKVDGTSVEELQTGFQQKKLKRWKETHGSHLAFTVLRHPVARAYTSFCRHILRRGPDCYPAIRQHLRQYYKLPIPKNNPDKTYTKADHKTAFLGYLTFVKANLNAQTGIRVDPAWASQSHILQGMSQAVVPDILIREDNIAAGLTYLTDSLLLPNPDYKPEPLPSRFKLSTIYDQQIETAVRAAYQKDYIAFGFDDWKPTPLVTQDPQSE